MARFSYPDIARIAGTGLISTGVGLLLFVVITMTWGDPFTRFSEAQAQADLAHEFTPLRSGTLQTARAVNPDLTRPLAFRARKNTRVGDAAGQLIIPRIGLKKLVVKGTEPDQLAKGPGFYNEPNTLFPGSGAAVAIAGHRTTHGAPFLDIDKLRTGDAIYVDMPYGRFTYQVTYQDIIDPNNWSIICPGADAAKGALARHLIGGRGGYCRQNPRAGEHLVLSACHPKYSAAQRIVVFAKLVKVQLKRSGA